MMKSKKNIIYRLTDEKWTPLMKQFATVNAQKHMGTIKSGAIVIHTLVKQCLYNVYMYNITKGIYEMLGTYRFIGEDSLNYKFEEVGSPLSNIEYHEITLPKPCDDRYFFQYMIQHNEEDDDICTRSSPTPTSVSD